MANWKLQGGKHHQIIPQKTAGEQRLKDRYETDMNYWRKTNQHISPAVGSTTLSDWLD
jgi:hypothetical protein